MIHRYREIQARRAEGEIPEAGFTLIELLIVIVVLGILAAIVIFSLTGVTASSAVSACNADAKTVEIAVSAYDAQVGSFPVGTFTTTATATPDLVPAYLHTWPDNTGTNYTVSYTGTATTGVVSVIVGGVTTAYDSESATAGCSQAT